MGLKRAQVCRLVLLLARSVIFSRALGVKQEARPEEFKLPSAFLHGGSGSSRAATREEAQHTVYIHAAVYLNRLNTNSASLERMQSEGRDFIVIVSRCTFIQTGLMTN